MKVDDNTIIEIKENTAVTRQMVENLDEKTNDNNERLKEHDEKLDEHGREIAKIKTVGALLALGITVGAGLHGWVVPFL